MNTIQLASQNRFGLVLAVLLAAGFSTAEGATRFGQVLKNGQVMVSGPGAATAARLLSCDDEQLLFTFAETVSPDNIALRRLDAGIADGSQMATIEVRIVQVCASSGQATFSYRHTADRGTIGQDIDINPAAPVLSLSLSPSASATAKVAYVVRPRSAETSEDDKNFQLRAAQISFFAGDVFGQAGRDEVLAEISISEAPPLKPGLISEDGDDDGRASAARDAFNDACLDPSAEGSVFLDICREVQNVEDEDLARRIAEAFDAHEIAALTAASSEAGRIQARNIASRMAALRGGDSQISLNGVALAYNGNLFDASWLPVSMSGLSLDEGSGGGSTLLNERLGVFLNGDISLGKRDQRGKEVAFDFDSWGLTAGLDYRFVNGVIAGLALGYTSYQADIKADGGKVDSAAVTVQGYGTYSFTDDFYVDATLGYSRADVDQQRVVDLTGLAGFGRSVARGSTDATQFSTSLALNYRLPLQRAWDITAYGQFYYAYNDIDSFVERGSPFAVEFPDQSFVTRTLTAGFRGSKAISFSRGILVPFVDAAFSHEGGNDGFVFTPMLVETGGLAPRIEISDPDRNYGRLDIGTSWVFLSGNQLFFSYGLLLGESDTKLHTLNFGARFEF